MSFHQQDRVQAALYHFIVCHLLVSTVAAEGFWEYSRMSLCHCEHLMLLGTAVAPAIGAAHYICIPALCSVNSGLVLPSATLSLTCIPDCCN